MNELFKIDAGLGADGEPVVIVGTGRMALLAHTALLQEGIAVRAFCDLSGKDAGLEIMGRPVVGVDAVLQMEKAHLVYAGENPQRAERDLARFGDRPAWIDRHAYGIVNDCVWSFM